MLESLIIDLFEKVNRKTITQENIDIIVTLLEENNLDDVTMVPIWFTDLFKSILQQENVPRTFYRREIHQGDITNFLAELEELINAEWNDCGEAVEVFFPNINMFVCISSEGNFYEIINQRKGLSTDA
ncbi:hypothetical protein I2486_07625 [Cellulophaga sp. E16_2]|uniref:hypothetical protein n=1 Tax=Cellulophaga sp. E16_2 TaxID=2789297 RepID=UPI001A936C95|nr:hypothetical protein [Cellulophaga sp. E16_2]MBO0591276.1 hypothetical protein [Cellulophaga sp. E16_2]